MTHRAILKAIPAVLLVCASGFAAAGQATTTVTATAQIPAVCRFNGAGTLAVGNINPSTATGDKTATDSSLSYNCTTGTTPSSLALSPASGAAGLRSMASPALDTLAYTLTPDLTATVLTTGKGFGTGKAISLPTITATITQTQYENAVAGSYSETVTIQLNY